MRVRFLIAVIAVTALVGTLAASAAVQPAFVEDFEDGDVAGWGWSPTGDNGIIEAVATPVSPSGGNYVGRVTFGDSCYGAGYTLDPATPDYVSWYFRADGDTGHPSGLALHWYGESGLTMASIGYRNGALRYHPEPGVIYNEIMPASTGTWYLIELKNIDWDTDTFDIWVDGVEKVVGVPFLQDVDDVRIIQNYACPSASGPSYVDDITFGFELPIPELTDDCKKGGWQDLTDHEGAPFKTQGDCVSYVATGGGNPANG